MPAFKDPEIYRDILDELQIGVSVLDLQCKIVFWSDGAEQISGYTRAEVLGHSCADNILQHCNQQGCELCNENCPLAATLRTSKAIEVVSFIHHKSGHRTPVHTWAIPLRNKNGSIIGIIQTFEGEVAVNGPNPNDQSMKERGWIDDATGLPNPAMMHSHLRETLGTFTELQVPFGIVCVEVLEIKEIRARYGQEASTAMLQVLSRTLRNSVWPTDYVGRWSDSRFLVILEGCGDDALQAVTTRIRRMMSSVTILWWGEELSVRASIGRAEAIPGDSVDSLLQRALEGFTEISASPQLSMSAAAPSRSKS